MTVAQRVAARSGKIDAGLQQLLPERLSLRGRCPDGGPVDGRRPRERAPRPRPSGRPPGRRTGTLSRALGHLLGHCRTDASRASGADQILSNRSVSQFATRANLEIGAMVAMLVLVGVAGWKLSERAELRVDPSPLARLPGTIGPWRSLDVPMDAAVESILRADYNLQRAYVSGTNESLWLYVGYYGTRRGGRPEHTPRGCYTGAGWGIEATRTLEIGKQGNLRANEYLVERDGAQQLVLFWYRSFRRTGILGGLDQNIDRLLGLLREGRADGALVRISTPVLDSDIVGARSRLQSFASLMDPLLGTHWPIELPCDDSTHGACDVIAEIESRRS